MNKLVITGPSGAGKGVLITRLLHDFSIQMSISHTTRKPRPGEIPGVSYHFVSDAEFMKLHAANAFMDSIELYGNRYGTVLSTSEHPTIFERDSRGVLVMGPFPDVFVVYIKPPSLLVLEQRLRARGTESETQIQHRLQVAAREMTFLETCEHVDAVVVNDELERAYTDLKKLVENHFLKVRVTRF